MDAARTPKLPAAGTLNRNLAAPAGNRNGHAATAAVTQGTVRPDVVDENAPSASDGRKGVIAGLLARARGRPQVAVAPALQVPGQQRVFEGPVERLWAHLDSDATKKQAQKDPFTRALHEQVSYAMKHVRLDVLDGAYPFDASLAAQWFGHTFDQALYPSDVKPLGPPIADLERRKQAALQRNDAYKRSVVENPVAAFRELKARFDAGGNNVRFPEFADVVEVMSLTLEEPEFRRVASESKHFAKLREIALDGLSVVAKDGCPYERTVEAIEAALVCIDVHERGSGKTTTPIYHNHRWKYYASFMKTEVPKHIMLPVVADLSGMDLIKVRGQPLGLVGTMARPQWADGHMNTQLEFWVHDYNHSRRAWEEMRRRADELGIPLEEYSQRCQKYLDEVLVPTLTIRENDDEHTKSIKRIMQMVMFEILHEDALPADPEIIAEALGRPPYTPARFVAERQAEDGKNVIYEHLPNATVLSFVFRKLEGEFYDRREERSDDLCPPLARTRENVAEAGRRLIEGLKLDIAPELMADYVKDDSGLPADFRAKVVKYASPEYGAWVSPLVEDARHAKEGTTP